jgi:hypothetical protein
VQVSGAARGDRVVRRRKLPSIGPVTSATAVTGGGPIAARRTRGAAVPGDDRRRSAMVRVGL